MNQNDRCKNCKYCAVLYIPPCECFATTTKACGGKKNAFVCTIFAEDNQVQYLGKSNNGMCEMFTEREETNNENERKST